ncbi:uncharacterized protein [Misgurnus anguillicaudatus]|uniref:uncharacterized protein n=1 Tax=Misgurnus anguillicaudatus TaxID=75329 RepID=UPI003CCF2A46
MASVADHRSVLVEIPEPQAKITGRLRRSYMDILGSRLVAGVRSRNLESVAVPRRALDGCSRKLRSRRRHDFLECQTSASNELLHSLMHAEQSVRTASSSSVPDLKILLEDLHQRKTSVYRSIPYSRLASNRDAHCYRKARPHLMSFKRSCQEGGRSLLLKAEWEKVLEFVLVACSYVDDLPQWETSGHNAIREQCYHKLADFCATALQEHPPAPRRARQLLHRFKADPVCMRVARPSLGELEMIVREYRCQKPK